MLSRLRSAGWPQELIDQMYLDEDTPAYAQATGEGEEDENKVIHRDSNGVILEGRFSSFNQRFERLSMVAKQGTAVRNIRLDHDNAEFIEGKVDGQTIVIITQYVKKL
jgi:protein PhnA